MASEARRRTRNATAAESAAADMSGASNHHPASRAASGPAIAAASAPGFSPARSLLAIIVAVLVLCVLAWHDHARMPLAPLPADAPADILNSSFSEGLARRHIDELASRIGFRMAGTPGCIQARDYILDQLQEYRRLATDNPFVETFDIELQTMSGTHRFSLLSMDIMKMYTNVTNIVARISCGPACNENAILVNSHYDSQ
ncbi:hypothetical protein HK405_013064, partial [Cladochytrium tenue]